MKNVSFMVIGLLLGSSLGIGCKSRNKIDERTPIEKHETQPAATPAVPSDEEKNTATRPEETKAQTGDEKAAEDMVKQIFDRGDSQSKPNTLASSSEGTRGNPTAAGAGTTAEPEKTFLCAPCAGYQTSYSSQESYNTNCPIFTKAVCPASTSTPVLSSASGTSASPSTSLSFPALSSDEKLAIEAIVKNTENKNLSLYNLKWNVEGGAINSTFLSKTGLNGIIQGRLAYRKDYALDENIYFAIELDNGVVKSIKNWRYEYLSQKDVDNKVMQNAIGLKVGLKLDATALQNMIFKVKDLKPKDQYEAATFIGARLALEVFRTRLL